MIRPYRRPGLQLQPRSGPPDPLVKALQEDLRSLGDLRADIDGEFGAGTSSAVRALQCDLLNAGQHGRDGDAPVALRTFNQGRVSGVTGIVDERLAACIEDVLDDHRVPVLPRAADPVHANADALARIQQLTGLPVPRAFLLAIFLQESGGMHYRVPNGGNDDDFIVVGLDRNDPGHPDHVTSRGYGIGQYTLFHNPRPPTRSRRSCRTQPRTRSGRSRSCGASTISSSPGRRPARRPTTGGGQRRGRSSRSVSMSAITTSG